MEVDISDLLPRVFVGTARRPPDFLQDIIQPVLEEMAIGLVRDMPPKPIPHMIRWLENKHYGGIQAQEQLKLQLAKLHHSLLDAYRAISLHEDSDEQRSAEIAGTQEVGVGSDESDEEPEEPPDLNIPPEKRNKVRRAISAEVYGEANPMPVYAPPTFRKTTAQRVWLREVLNQLFPFQKLGRDEMRAVISAMEKREVAPTQQIATRGEYGSSLFVVEKGQFAILCAQRPLRCGTASDALRTAFKTQNREDTLQAGDIFGEVALLHNHVHTVSAEAVEESVVWELPRETFNGIVRNATVTTRNRYMCFLSNIPLLRSLTAQECAQIADVLQLRIVEEGTDIVTEGVYAGELYIIDEGRCASLRSGVRVVEYCDGDYFGELSLVCAVPMAETVQAMSTVTLLSITREAFTNVLGPLRPILARRSAA
eukprot:GEMP01041643.1.p1 GENE.GEMP01041643.1~~GEMP01041643.1.p1  ORF type:complete len:425 (+),score=107.71 GEMP01041643.1:24-1298(+)